MAESKSEPGECKPVDGAASNPPASVSENSKAGRNLTVIARSGLWYFAIPDRKSGSVP